MGVRGRVIISGVLGILLTIAQCWLLSLQAVPQSLSVWPPIPGKTYDWPIEVPAGWPTCAEFSRWRGVGMWRHHAANQNALSSRLADHFATRDFIGWPFAAMESRRLEINSLTGGSSPPPKFSFDSGIEVRIGGGPGMRMCYLPLRPIPAGFAANSLLYGVLAFILLRGIREIHRTIRASRGACIVCGYPLAQLPRCPECGAERAVPARDP